MFPKIAQYKGNGNPNDASNWACAAERVTALNGEADEVLPNFGNREQQEYDDDD